VATIAPSSSASRAAKAPISTHPAFPAIVALWFAALLGLGSLVLPVALIEKLVVVTRISSLISAAEPPLGFTARAGIAIAASFAGAVIGLFLARKVASSSAAEPTGRNFALGAERQCRPISAPDELGEDGLDAPELVASPLLQKRRSLTMAEDNRPSAYLQAVPMPGQSIENRAEFSLSDEISPPEPAAATDRIIEASYEPLELGAFVAPEDDEEEESTEGDDGLEALRRQIHTPDTPAMPLSPMTDETFDPAEFEREPAHADPLPFAAPSLRRSLTPALDQEEQVGVRQDYDLEEAMDEEAFVDEPVPQLSIVEPDGEPDTDERAVEELGLVQLAARLGASIEKRRAWLAERQKAAPSSPAPSALAPFGDAADFEAAEAEDAARAIADFFGPPEAEETREIANDSEPPAPQFEPAFSPVAPLGAAMPAPLRGVPLDQDDEEDESALAASFSLPLGGSISEAEVASTGEEDGFDEEEPEDSEYSSLLAMKNPFVREQEFVRVEQPEDESGSVEPAVTFPASVPSVRESAGQAQVPASGPRPFDPPTKPVEGALRPAPALAPRDPDDAERSLRDALATLQRMSGAA
jgi:hypothetical protein